MRTNKSYYNGGEPVVMELINLTIMGGRGRRRSTEREKEQSIIIQNRVGQKDINQKGGEAGD